MLDLDAIEREITADKYGDKRFGPQCLSLIAELRKCRAAMEESREQIDTVAGRTTHDDELLLMARDNLDEALRGAK